MVFNRIYHQYLHCHRVKVVRSLMVRYRLFHRRTHFRCLARGLALYFRRYLTVLVVRRRLLRCLRVRWAVVPAEVYFVPVRLFQQVQQVLYLVELFAEVHFRLLALKLPVLLRVPAEYFVAVYFRLLALKLPVLLRVQAEYFVAVYFRLLVL